MFYQAPCKDMRFVLNELADLSTVCRLPAATECSVALVDTILEEAAKFAQAVLAPTNQPGDQGAVWQDGEVSTPPGFQQAWRHYVEAAWPGLRIAPQWGGQGLPALLATAVEEMWSAANLALSLAPLPASGVISILEKYAKPELQALYAPRLASGEWTSTMDLTEPQAGSDLATIRTRAMAQADGSYHLIGQKIFITWGEQDLSSNIIHLVLARTPDAPAGVKGLSLFIVPKFLVNADASLGARNDLRCVSLEHKMGIRGSPTAMMSFGDQGGAVGYLVGALNQGLSYMFTLMNHARLGVGIQGLALSERAYQAAVSYARERIQGRALASSDHSKVPIMQHPDVRRMLMTMRAQIEAQRALAYYTAALLDKLERHSVATEAQHSQALLGFLIPIVKAWNTEQANEITSLAIQIHGGMGFIEETGVAQYYRDVRITSIYEGTTGIQALDLIGRKTAHESGASAYYLLGEAKKTAHQLSATVCIEQGQALLSAIEQAESCVAYMVAHFPQQPALAAAGSVPFLTLMGITLGGWQMARAALIAQQKLRDGAEDTAFYQAKRVTAQFYSQHILPQVSGLSTAILSGANSVLALEEASF